MLRIRSPPSHLLSRIRSSADGHHVHKDGGHYLRNGSDLRDVTSTSVISVELRTTRTLITFLKSEPFRIYKLPIKKSPNLD